MDESLHDSKDVQVVEALPLDGKQERAEDASQEPKHADVEQGSDPVVQEEEDTGIIEWDPHNRYCRVRLT